MDQLVCPLSDDDEVREKFFFILGRVMRFLTMPDFQGFGFITPDNGGEDIFVHQSSLHCRGFRSLAENAKVEYEVANEDGRQKAVNVTGPNGELCEVSA